MEIEKYVSSPKYLEGRNHSILSYVAYLGLIRFLYLTLNIVRITAVVYNTLLENLKSDCDNH